MIEGETSQIQYKFIEYNDTIYQVPIRNMDQENVILLSDVQSIFPKATALLSNSKLIPFKLDPLHHTELLPKRIPIINDQNIWQVHVPNDQDNNTTTLEFRLKLDQLNEKLDYLISLHQPQQQEVNSDQLELSLDNATFRSVNDVNNNNSPPPAFSSPSHVPSSSSSSSSPPLLLSASCQQDHQQHNSSNNHQHHQEAPPSYETSILSTIKDINEKLRLFESHIPNRHKSPKWLAKRDEWLNREPNSIEQVAYQLVQLEMALLWTAVTESWIQERETWLSLVASAQTERHLASAIINLERYTLVMDQEWSQIRERWINDLLEFVVLPLSHG